MGLIEWAINALKDLGVYGVFIGVVLENIFTLIPSALVPLMAGAIIIPSDATQTNVIIQSLISIGFTGAFASTICTTPLYILSYIGGKKLIDKFGGYIGISWNEVEKVKVKIEGKNDFAIILLRFLPVIPISPVSIALGIVRYGAMRFILTTFIGVLPRYLTLGLIGWMMREAIWTIIYVMEAIETIIITAISLSILTYIILKVIKRSRH